jgi:hypothetical protein
MSDVVLATMNARHSHAAFGVRYLKANLGAHEARCEILEFTTDARPIDVVEQLLARAPRIIGLSVYIWNVVELSEVVRLLKRVRPDIVVVIGGPEVSHEQDDQDICARADYVVADEGDLAFAQLVDALLAGKRPLLKAIEGGKPDLGAIAMPYRLYTDTDLATRTIYVEASRGCPFKCEFCLSSLDKTARPFDLDVFLGEMDALLARGLKSFKFVDRTFNLKIEESARILDFFLARMHDGLFLHFEMIPDRLPEALQERLRRFPPGSVQLEVGIQTFDDEVAARISRRQDAAKIEQNLRFLRAETGVHVHADLIVGLPGESLAMFGRGFDRLHALAPHEIQVGVLKRLRGTPIGRHDVAHGMIYAADPPYEILSTGAMSFSDVMQAKRFARAWDLVMNSGRFPRTGALLVDGPSAFAAFDAFTRHLVAITGALTGIALARLGDILRSYLVDVRALDPAVVGAALVADLGRDRAPKSVLDVVPKRQARHRRAPNAGMVAADAAGGRNGSR